MSIQFSYVALYAPLGYKQQRRGLLQTSGQNICRIK